MLTSTLVFALTTCHPWVGAGPLRWAGLFLASPRRGATGGAGPSLRYGPAGASRRYSEASNHAFRPRTAPVPAGDGVVTMRQHHDQRVLETRYLSSRQRVVLRAVRDEELSYPDMAGRLGLTVTEVEAEFAAALVALVAAADWQPPNVFYRALRRWLRRWRR